MSLFLLTFLTVYGGVHGYAFLKARNALGFGWGPGIGLTALMAIMVTAPMLIRLLDRLGHEAAARTLSYAAYLWMAVIFLFFCSSLALDLLNIAGRLIAALRGAGPVLIVPARSAFLVSICLALLICLYGYFEALNIRTERITVATSKLPAGVDRLTIAQISDVHLGLIVRCPRMEKILHAVKAADPDILVSTGDLVDAEINHLPGLREMLQEIRPRHGKYAVTGNHEYYAGLEQALAFTRQAGFTVLRGGSAEAGGIVIIGVDDPAGVQILNEEPPSENKTLLQLPRDRFILLLKHRPVIEKGSLGLFDLQLSGHTHKGQIWPFSFLSAISYPLSNGQYDLDQGSIVYVSRGTGTWGPPVRFLSPPQITIVDIIRK